MANTTWHQLFPALENQFLEFRESYHRPMVTYLSDLVFEERRGMFCFDNRLTHKEGFKESVLKGWNGTSIFFLLRSLSALESKDDAIKFLLGKKVIA